MTKSNTILEELFAAKAHLGHKKNRIHPRAKKFIYKIENGVSIIDLSETVKYLSLAEEYLKKAAKEGKLLLVVATKKIAARTIQELCQANNIAYVTSKWPAGLLTNFETIRKNTKKMITMKKEKEEGAWNMFVKHEQNALSKKLNKLEHQYEGLEFMEKLPDILYVVDVKKEKNAVLEALSNHVPIVAISDTNINPDTVSYPIPANDDSQSSVEYISKKVIESYANGKH